MAGAAVVALAAVLFFLLKPLLGGTSNPDGASPGLLSTQGMVEIAVTQAGKICLADATETQKRQIEANLSAALVKAGAEGSTTEERTTRYVDLALSEAGTLAAREAVQECMASQTFALLSFLARQDDPALTPAEAESRIEVDPALSRSAIGYVYFEEDGGTLTDDGVFRPLSTAAVPPYAEVQAGDILISVRSARLREGPTGNDLLVRSLDAGQCVKVLEPPAHPVANLTSATSGGRIRVQAIPCPRQPNA